MKMAEKAGLKATIVDPSAVARTQVAGELCSSENLDFPCQGGGGHQCTPSLPDVIAWELQKHLSAARHTSTRGCITPGRCHGHGAPGSSPADLAT